VRARLLVDGVGDSKVEFYTAGSVNGPWVLVDTVTSAAAVDIFASSSEATIGADGDGGSPFEGLVYRIQVRPLLDGVALPLVADPDFTVLDAGILSVSDSTGLDWALSGGAEIFAPPPGPVDIEVGGIGMRWYGCDLVTGSIIAELPGLKIEGNVSRLVGAYTNARATLPIPIAGPEVPPPGWQAATQPGRGMLVGVPRATGEPIWAGYVNWRRGGTGHLLELSLSTLEAYYSRRFIRDHTWVDEDASSVIAFGLAVDGEDIDGIGSGIGVEIDAPAVGALASRNYKRQDRKTIYGAWEELMSSDLLEWTIDIAWADPAHSRFAKILRFADRIGTASTTPKAIFQTKSSSEAEYTYTEDFSRDRGGNYVTAYSSGQGEDQPESEPAYDAALLAAGFPIWEIVWQPSSSISSAETLTEHAVHRLEDNRLGINTWTLEARWSRYPILGEDWNLGDDIGWEVVGHRHPDGASGTARCIGWELRVEEDVAVPIILDPREDESGGE
jgi:hypothetical protein